MNEIFQKLLESNILTEDTRKELEEAFQKQVDEAVSEAKQKATEEVTASIHESWVTERNTLIEALDSRVTTLLTPEILELKEDIDRFRDLDAEYAHRIVEAKVEMSETLKGDITQLLEKLDNFLEIRLTEEVDELRDDIATIRQQQFGRDIFEAFVSTYKKFHQSNESELETRLSEMEQRLEDTTTALSEEQAKASKLERSIKMENVLKPLSGKSREVMEAILTSVKTANLEEAYRTYVGRVITESSKHQPPAEKEKAVLAEGSESKKEKVQGFVKSGDNKEVIAEDRKVTESERRTVTSLTESERTRLRALGGLN